MNSDFNDKPSFLQSALYYLNHGRDIIVVGAVAGTLAIVISTVCHFPGW
ncbi:MULTISPECIES: hypothetical protein [Pandoraea]|uniref:Uncharacterized protein n=2 Tax=Pandoraea TaxID=93217 RepID=A0A5E4XFH8_9BURK|nr:MULTISPECIES: hypothetical protein [Pandoraea]VVE17153.1 hypothetical protein PCE31107_02955 [Pandoraea cepalis]VVE34935.1 hypothetical protein PTE31013_03875 [Pandoraea terrigena]